MSHTPGPWEVETHANGCVFVTRPHASASRGDVADLYHTVLDVNSRQKIITKQNAEANAHLIAAAPDMFRELVAARTIVEKWCHYQGNTPELFDQFLTPIDAAISKAKGETE
jgi:hypothetical protein